MEQPVDPTITLETCGPVSCCDVLPPAAADGACPCGANNNCPDPNELQGDIIVFPKVSIGEYIVCLPVQEDN